MLNLNLRRMANLLLAGTALLVWSLGDSGSLIPVHAVANAADGGVSPSEVPAPSGAEPDRLTLLSPSEYQVFQRRDRSSGFAWLSGHVSAALDRLEARITGRSVNGSLDGEWVEVPYDRVTGGFGTWIPVSAGGWYRLEVRATHQGQSTAAATVNAVGVGEVFVTAGQSNSTNCGEAPTKLKHGMMSSFSGTGWRLGDDPQLGVRDGSDLGSPWPAFGDALYEKQRVPIAVAITGHGPSSVRDWGPNSDYFAWMMKRMDKLGRGGFRAVLWHQGESDVGQIGNDEYFAGLRETIEGSYRQSGWRFPWFVAMVGMQDAQRKLWTTETALEGPDTDVLHGERYRYMGGAHFTLEGLQVHGTLWADKVHAYLEKALGPEPGR